MSDPKDTGSFTLSSGPHTPAPASAKDDLAAFVAEVRRVTAAAKKLKGKLAANTVTVEPGGQTFSTITDALNSITDASQKREYVVEIGPGTYNEMVTCKPWVFLSGPDPQHPEQTVIAPPAQPKPTSLATVTAASNSAIQNCTVQAAPGPGVAIGSTLFAVVCQSVTNFDIESCQLLATDPAHTVHIAALSVDYPGGSKSQVNVAYTTVTADGGVQIAGLFASNGAFVNGTESRFVSQHSTQSTWGACAYSGANLQVEDCYAEGTTYSLNMDQYGSKVTANHCTLVGPVAPGVVVNP